MEMAKLWQFIENALQLMTAHRDAKNEKKERGKEWPFLSHFKCPYKLQMSWVMSLRNNPVGHLQISEQFVRK